MKLMIYGCGWCSGDCFWISMTIENLLSSCFVALIIYVNQTKLTRSFQRLPSRLSSIRMLLFFYKYFLKSMILIRHRSLYLQLVEKGTVFIGKQDIHTFVIIAISNLACVSLDVVFKKLLDIFTF